MQHWFIPKHVHRMTLFKTPEIFFTMLLFTMSPMITLSNNKILTILFSNKMKGVFIRKVADSHLVPSHLAKLMT